MKFCSDCGSTVALRIPDDDNRERFVCTSCDTVHYQNPNMVVGTIPLWEEAGSEPKILLCKRNIEPRFGYWTLPAGFLENGESTLEGAARETLEESCADLSDLEMYRVINVKRTNQVHLFFRANMRSPDFSTTSESSEVALFAFSDIPWRELAFPTVYRALKDYVDDWPRQEFPSAMTDVSKRDWAELEMHDRSTG